MAHATNKPGVDNWVSRNGGLPSYIDRIAGRLEAQGMPTARAISTAIATVKRWAAGGGKVSAKTRAKASAAVAQWEALKARARASK